MRYVSWLIVVVMLVWSGSVMAQNRSVARMKKPTVKQGVVIKGTPASFNAARRKVKTLSADAIKQTKGAQRLKGKALNGQLKGLLVKFDGIDGECRKQLNMLRGGPNRGKTRQVMTLNLQIRQKTKQAKSMVKAAMKANNARDFQAAQRSMDQAVNLSKSINDLSAKLVLLEPVVYR